MIAPTAAPAPIFSGVFLVAARFERLRHRRANRIIAAVDGDLIEAQCKLALALDATGIVDRRHDTTHARARRDQHAAVLAKVNDGGRFEAIFDLLRIRAQRPLEPHIELGPDGNDAGAACRTSTRRRSCWFASRCCSGRCSCHCH